MSKSKDFHAEQMLNPIEQMLNIDAQEQAKTQGAILASMMMLSVNTEKKSVLNELTLDSQNDKRNIGM
jgi:hypothetical protein